MVEQILANQKVLNQENSKYPSVYKVGDEQLEKNEIRVTIIGSGDPWPRKTQASGSIVMEVGNDKKDFFFFDIGSGALTNFTGLHLPVTGTTKVFLSHLHADHIGDIPGLLGSFAKIGRIDPVEIWGGASDIPNHGITEFVENMTNALTWDTDSIKGIKSTTGTKAIAHEVSYDKPGVVYENNGVKISSFPVIHALNGAVGYKLEYAGLKVVFSGDTRPCDYVVEAAQGSDLLIHECFQSPAVAAKSLNLDITIAKNLLKQAHTIPDQVGQIFAKTKPRMAALWHLDLRPGVEQVLKEIEKHYSGPVVASQDLTVFNVTKDTIVARQTKLDPMAPVIKDKSFTKPKMDKPNKPPKWWSDHGLDL